MGAKEQGMVAVVEGCKEFFTREGQSAVFTARVVGSNYEAVWYHKNKKVKASRYFKITECQGLHQLEITEVYPEDAGQYRLIVTGQKNEVSTAAVLKLDSKYTPLKILKKIIPRLEISVVS